MQFELYNRTKLCVRIDCISLGWSVVVIILTAVVIVVVVIVIVVIIIVGRDCVLVCVGFRLSTVSFEGIGGNYN